MAVKLTGWQRLWIVLSALWFFGWLVGFPLYVKSKDLVYTEFVFQKFLDAMRYRKGTEPEPKFTTEEIAGEIERIGPVFKQDRIEAFLKDNPRLAQELKDEDERFAREHSALMWQLTPEEPISRLIDRVNEQTRQQFNNSVYKKVLLTVAKEDVTLVNIYKRLLKSNWSGWGLYVLLGPLVAYAGIYGGILAMRWVMHGFHNSAGV